MTAYLYGVRRRVWSERLSTDEKLTRWPHGLILVADGNPEKVSWEQAYHRGTWMYPVGITLLPGAHS